MAASKNFAGLLSSFLSRQYFYRYAFLLGILLLIPGIFSGFFADDYGHYNLVKTPQLLEQPALPSINHLFSFIDQNEEKRLQQYAYSLIPWWTDESFVLNFFRPVAELTHLMDYQWFSKQAWLMHIHSLLWYGLLLVGFYCLLKQLPISASVRALGFLLFCVDATHGFTVSWLANRNLILAAAFGVFSLVLFIKHVKNGQVHLLVGSMLLLLLCLLSAELGVGIAGALCAYILVLDERCWKHKLLSLTPVILLLVAWFAFYQSQGFGINSQQGYYLNPAEMPVLFFEKLLVRLPKAVFILFGPGPFQFMPQLDTAVIVMGWIILAGLVGLAFILKDKWYTFLLLALFAAVVPACASVMQERNLLLATLFSSLLLAYLLFTWIERAGILTSCGKVYIVVCHILLSAALLPIMSYAPAIQAQGMHKLAVDMQAYDKKSVVGIGLPVFDASFLVPIQRFHQNGEVKRFWNVLSKKKGVEIERLSALEYELSGESLFYGDDRLFRNFSVSPLLEGHEVDLNGAVVRVLQVDGFNVQSVLLRIGDTNEDHVLVYREQGKVKTLQLNIGQKKRF